jgi:hypothetical protein
MHAHTKEITERGHWASVAFCASLCAITLVQSIGGAFSEGLGRNWQLVFLAFLPMCFYYVAAVTTDMRRQILELKTQVEQLRKTSA